MMPGRIEQLELDDQGDQNDDSQQNDDGRQNDDSQQNDDSRQNEQVSDRGASLIMAIGFMVLIGAIAAGLSSLVTSSNYNRLSLDIVRDRQYAADGAVEEAVTAVRFLDRSSDGSCEASAGSSTSDLNQLKIRVDWENVCGVVRTVAGELVAQRNVVFSACVDTGDACRDGDVIVRAQVNFEQADTGEVTRTWVQSWSVLQ